MKEENKAENYLPGIKPVLELVEKSPEKIDTVFIRKDKPNKDRELLLDLCNDYGVHFSLVSNDVFSRMASQVNHQGVIARLRCFSSIASELLFENALQSPLPLIVALDQVQDPGNVGTLARTMYAMGCGGLLVPRHNSAFLGAAAQRSAAGALEYLPTSQVTNLSRAVEEGKERGYTIYAAQKGENALNPLKDKLELPAILILGNEEKGIRKHISMKSDYTLEIPFLRNFDSLNVAQAGGILISCFLRMLV